jgi:hypothetical protein
MMELFMFTGGGMQSGLEFSSWYVFFYCKSLTSLKILSVLGERLLHLWLAKRELESRRVKDRDFKGVDIRELDLLPSFYH